jgi:hypothetical protein
LKKPTPFQWLGGKHDDQVDSTTQALDYLREPDVVARFIRAFGS